MAGKSTDNTDYLIQTMQKDLDQALAEESNNGSLQFEKTRGAMITVLRDSVETQRLYFVVRSVLMSLMSALIYFIVVFYLGSIDAVQAAVLGVFVFVAALVVSRLFDRQIVVASKKIVRFLSKYARIRAFVLKRL